MSLLVILLNAITGFFVVRLAWPNGARFCRHDILRASLGAGLGLGLSSLVTFFADAFFGGGAAVVLGGDIVLFAAAASCVAWRRNNPCRFCVRSAAPGGFVLYGCAAAAVTAAMAAFVLFTLNNPYGEWDAWAIWNNHARFLASVSSRVCASRWQTRKMSSITASSTPCAVAISRISAATR